MKHNHVLCLNPNGFHRMHYMEWGESDNPRIIICAHGLTRNARDFDVLAQALAADFRVISVDIAGRGESDWLPDKAHYTYRQYLADTTTLIGRLTGQDGVQIDWVGTSMGGILGMLVASLPGQPLRRLVVNDISALIPKAALERIATYVGGDPRFGSFAELETFVRKVSAPFGPLTDEQWHHLALHAAKQHADGTWGLRYDPGIAVPFREAANGDIDLWQHWDAVTCPTLLLRGAESDLLTHDAAAQMTQRGPRPRLVEFAGIGHAPMLMAADQIAVVRAFLLE
jgi:pimeloyl-ACP methyl ester carboxylesterase